MEKKNWKRGAGLPPIGFAVMAVLSGCGGEDATVAEETCSRLDTCNYLLGSVAECVEEIDRDLDDLTSTERADVETDLNRCLGFSNCDRLVECIDDI